MTAFAPDGTILVTFEDGMIRVWQSDYQDDQPDKPSRKQMGKKPIDISELGQIQFNTMDEFDIFDNPHGLEQMTDDDRKQLDQLYRVSLTANLLIDCL